MVGSKDGGDVMGFRSVVCLRAFGGGLVLRIGGLKGVLVCSDLGRCRGALPPGFLEYRGSFAIGVGRVADCRPCGFVATSNDRVPVPPGGCGSMVDVCGGCLGGL